MLSVQAPGCAGMERLGAPGGPRLRHDHRHHPHHALACGQQLEQVVGRLLEQQARARSAAAAERLGLPPSLTLPDGEHGQDAHLQIRAPYQQAELTRSSIQPPPNKSVSDVPEWAGGVETASAPRRSSPSKKDGFVQKAVRYLYRMGARPPPPAILQQLGANELAAQRLQRELRRSTPPAPPAIVSPAPCVMVPLRAPHAPPAPHPPPDA